MSCHLFRNYRLTREKLFAELEEIEPLYISDLFGAHLVSCRECARFFIYCFRKITRADYREESWAFWIPVQPADIAVVKGAPRMFKSLADLIATRPHIYMDPRNQISWSNTGNPEIGFTVFAVI